MSREERRQYERMMRNMERGPAIPPAARIRAERKAARRAARATAGPQSYRFTPRFLLRSIGIALVVGFIALSLQWSEPMPQPLYAGLAVTAAALVVQMGIRLLQRRRAASRN